MIPRYLKSDTTMSFSPSIKTSACCALVDFLEKNVVNVKIDMTFLASQKHGPVLQLV